MKIKLTLTKSIWLEVDGPDEVATEELYEHLPSDRYDPDWEVEDLELTAVETDHCGQLDIGQHFHWRDRPTRWTFSVEGMDREFDTLADALQFVADLEATA